MCPDAFIPGDTLRQHTKNYKEVVAIFTNMMFKFRQTHKKGILRLEDLCKIQAAACVKKTKEKYGKPNKILHIQEVCDHRADRTKDATEQKRGDTPPTALDFSTLIDTDFSEKIPNYSSQWRDRGFGRTTAYSTYFKKRENVTSLNLWDGVRHVITGEAGDLCTAYDVTKRKVKYLDNSYNCRHPEADTGVFYSSKAFFDQHGSANPNTTVIIDCPETHCIKIVLYKYDEIKSLLHSHQLKLFCKLHNQLVEEATGKKVKASSKRKTVTGHTIDKQEFYLDFAKLGELIASDDSYKDLQYPQESLGVLSIITGNEKIPAFLSCTKTMALNQFRKQCSEGRMLDLVNPQTVQFDDTLTTVNVLIV